MAPAAVICLVLAAIFSGCVWPQAGGYVPPLEVTGDIAHPLRIKDPAEYEQVSFEDRDTRQRGIPLEALMRGREPLTEDFSLLLVGDDGLVAKIAGNQLYWSYILFSRENGWHAVHLHHPPSADVKHLEHLVVVAQGEIPLDKSINLIRQDRNISGITPGRVFAQELLTSPFWEGRSSLEIGGISYPVSVYTRRSVLPVAHLDGFREGHPYVVVGRQGKVVDGHKGGYLQWMGNQLRYLSLDVRVTVDDVVGIMMDPPEDSIIDLHGRVLASLERNEAVLVILLDGFGYHQYLYAKKQGYLPFLGSLPAAQPALAAYKPVSNTGLAAMITGQWPHINGVHSREQRIMNTPSFFAAILESGKQAALLQGNVGVLKTEIEPTLHLDLDESGDSDEEILATALQKVDHGYDLLMVHFDSIDDAGHATGDMSRAVMEAIRRSDDYIRALVKAWSGPVYIVSDHGMHQQNDEGYHGVFRYEDMVVPFIAVRGKGATAP